MLKFKYNFKISFIFVIFKNLFKKVEKMLLILKWNMRFLEILDISKILDFFVTVNLSFLKRSRYRDASFKEFFKLLTLK